MREEVCQAEARIVVVEREMREREAKGRERIAQLEAQCLELQQKNQLIEQQQVRTSSLILPSLPSLPPSPPLPLTPAC